MTQIIPILLYHSVPELDLGDSFSVASDRFRDHAKAIAASGRTALTITEIADGVRGLRPLPVRAVGITFDDGYQDTVAAIDVLQAHGLRASVYVTTGQLGEGSSIRHEHVRTLAGWRESVELGAHSVTHPYLDELSIPAAADEIRSSKHALEQLIDHPVASFAYPHGAYDARIRELVIGAGYRSAAGVKNAFSHSNDDPWAIARWTVRSTTTAADVEAFLAGGGAPLAWPQERFRTRAYRGMRRMRRRLVSGPVEGRGMGVSDVTRPGADFRLGTGNGSGRGDIATPNNSSGVEPLLSVVVPTCADAAAAVRCVTKIREHACEPLEVIVVENRPADSDVSAALSAAFGRHGGVRYVEEPTPGLSRARNAGLAAANGNIVAFIDDDVAVGEQWLRSLRNAFAAHPDATCVTGLILPLELATPAQALLEQVASFGKGSTQRVYSAAAPPPDIPLFPYTAGHFGSGANMAFKREALTKLGGFDPVLGTGTLAKGGEDLDICIRLILGGQTLVYEPQAVVWHRHPDTMRRLHRQVFNYGVGLGALITKHLTTGRHRADLIRRIPAALMYLFGRGSRKNAGKGPDFPRRLEVLELIGLALGPIGYARSRRQAVDQAEADNGASNREQEPARRVWRGELDLADPVVADNLRLDLPAVPMPGEARAAR